MSISQGGRIAGKVHADNVLVNGTVEGPIHGAQVTLGATARVSGDVHHESFVVERGAFFAGSSLQDKPPAAAQLAKAGADEYAAFKRDVASTRRRKTAGRNGAGTSKVA